MLQVSDNLLGEFSEVDKKYHLLEFINNKKFTVSDTPLTYRQINSLDEDKLLDNSRKDKKGWRKFSFKELIYVMIVAEVKKFGLKHEQLHGLWRAFLGKNEGMQLGGYAQLAIGCVFGHTQIMLSIYSDGTVAFYDPNNFILFSSMFQKPQLTLELNTYVNDLLRKIGRDVIEPKYTLFSVLSKAIITTVNPKEKELLKIIRDEKYSAVKVKKKNGEIELVRAETTSSTDNLSSKDLLEIIKKHEYQDIVIVQRDGKIVNLKVEEAYKL